MTEVVRPGDVIAERYRIVRPIGQGGMGVVYEGEQLATGRKVAVKALVENDPSSSERFEREARAMAKLADPRIAAVIDFVREPGVPALLVMELLEGVSLATLLRRTGPLPIDRAVRITIQILEGLAAAHAMSIVHRDVKPSNIFLVTDGLGRETVKLLDFGVAKVLDATTGATTTTGAVVGTPSYLAPEQIRGELVDARTDLHAVGVCLFEMLAGRRPWRSQGAELVAEILRDRPLSFADVGVVVPPEIAAVVTRALAADRNGRFSDAYAMIDALRGSSRREERAPPIAATPAPSPDRSPLPMLVAGVLLLALGVAIVVKRHPRAEVDSPPTAPSALPPVPPVLSAYPDPEPAPQPTVVVSNAPTPSAKPHPSRARGPLPSPAQVEGMLVASDPLTGELPKPTDPIRGRDCFCYPLAIRNNYALPHLECDRCAWVDIDGPRGCKGRDAEGRMQSGTWLCGLTYGRRVKPSSVDQGSRF